MSIASNQAPCIGLQEVLKGLGTYHHRPPSRIGAIPDAGTGMPLHKPAASAAFLLGLFAAMLCAQIRSNTITGTLRDASGAVIPDADLVLTNQETNISFHTKTTAAGEFTFPYLQQGMYTLSVKVAGFAVYRERDLRLETDQTLRADASLKVGTSPPVVEVRAQAAQLHTDSSTIEDTTQAAAIAALPNITQNPMYYAQLEEGVVPRSVSGLSQQTTWMNSFGIGFYGRMNWLAMGVNGGRAFTNHIQLDGLAVMSSGYNEAAVVPNTEALEEVRVISNDYTAEYGRGQGVISMMTKSGTIDWSIRKTFNIRENVQLQIGADATNFLNHTQYALIPGGTINNNLGNTNTSPSSGPIGVGTNYAYGTYGEQSFDPRQFVLNARIRF